MEVVEVAEDEMGGVGAVEYGSRAYSRSEFRFGREEDRSLEIEKK